MAHAHGLSPSVRERLLEEAAGNPLALVELAHLASIREALFVARDIGQVRDLLDAGGDDERWSFRTVQEAVDAAERRSRDDG